MKALLSGNDALALGAYHAGVKVATAYPGTPSTEILTALARRSDIYAEWSTNEKVAMEVAIGACYTGVRALVSMKHVGLNVASDPFMAVAGTGIVGGLVIISADDPGMHSSQNEQDNRYFAKLAKIPILEPNDSQSAHDLMIDAFNISERFDTPVMVRSTTRISHAKSIVATEMEHGHDTVTPKFDQNAAKLVLLPANARLRHPVALARLQELARFSDSFPRNQLMWGRMEFGIISSGVAYQYAREIFPDASMLKLELSYPLPAELIRKLADQVKHLVVIEELEPFMEEQIKAMGIAVEGKKYLPQNGELTPDIVREAGLKAGWLENAQEPQAIRTRQKPALAARPPSLCPGCPHTGVFFILSTLGIRRVKDGHAGLIINGDIGCYTLAAYQPLSAIDTCTCMGAGIGHAQGMFHAGIEQTPVAVIGDSTFLHSGMTSLLNAVYNASPVLTIILDNHTTAMTGHQPHPGSGITAQSHSASAVSIGELVKGLGVKQVREVSSFDLAAIRAAIKESLAIPEVSVIIARGDCAMLSKKKTPALSIDTVACDHCENCLKLGCPAIQRQGRTIIIDAQQCIGTSCSLCRQVCPNKAINLRK